jgi:hypothetical protein
MGKFWDTVKSMESKIGQEFKELGDGIGKELDNYDYQLREMSRPTELDRPHHPPHPPEPPHKPTGLPRVEQVHEAAAGRHHDKGLEL